MPGCLERMCNITPTSRRAICAVCAIRLGYHGSQNSNTVTLCHGLCPRVILHIAQVAAALTRHGVQDVTHCRQREATFVGR